jgi:hypothetical protein
MKSERLTYYQPPSRAVGVMAGVAVSLSLLFTVARANDGVPITIVNDGTSDIIVTVYDLNASPRRVVVPGERIGSFSSIPINVTPGNDGTGHVAWTANSVDPDSHLCGHANREGLQISASVHVHADVTCTDS